MERITKAQALHNTSIMGYMAAKKAPRRDQPGPLDHGLPPRGKAKQADKNDRSVKDVVTLLYDETALLSSGFSLEDPQLHTNRMVKLVGLGIEDDEVDKTGDAADAAPGKMPPLEEVGEDASITKPCWLRYELSH